jgi:acyl-CoA synthetase (NDP forming)
VPHTGSINNPVDLTFSRNPLDYYSHIPKALIEEKNADMLLVYCFTPSQNITRALAFIGVPEDEITETRERIISEQSETLARLLERHDKPLVGYTWRSMEEAFIKGLLERGVPVFPGPERAARALAAMARYAQVREEILSRVS